MHWTPVLHVLDVFLRIERTQCHAKIFEKLTFLIVFKEAKYVAPS